MEVVATLSRAINVAFKILFPRTAGIFKINESSAASTAVAWNRVTNRHQNRAGFSADQYANLAKVYVSTKVNNAPSFSFLLMRINLNKLKQLLLSIAIAQIISTLQA